MSKGNSAWKPRKPQAPFLAAYDKAVSAVIKSADMGPLPEAPWKCPDRVTVGRHEMAAVLRLLTTAGQVVTGDKLQTPAKARAALKRRIVSQGQNAFKRPARWEKLK